jgi:AICAR transformylase/IMP cyclohydrolase PurH
MHDLAGAHYSIETIALMKENLPFCNNTTNHQNVPQDRLIENLTLVRPCMVNLPAQNHMDNLILKYII